ncbi:MAG: hypothetical protein LQ342_002705 [Letrouitia transgressa]|nr:MAG: hypothetical protein LQ342_002705 [Letrouitia transgressa]
MATETFSIPQVDPTMDVPANVSSTEHPTPNSSSTTPPAAPPHKAKSLSCGTCRERKVRCDKNQPCSTCQRAKVNCVFPSAKRLPRKRQGERKKTNEKLLQRLGRLEALVEKAGLDEKDGKPEKAKPSPKRQVSEQANDANGDVTRQKREASTTSLSSGSQQAGKSAVEREMGRYLGSNFWANLTDEVEGLRLELNESSDEKADEDDDDDNDNDDYHNLDTLSHSPKPPLSRYGFIFNFGSPRINLRSLHPSPKHIEALWAIYTVNVDPINRIVHKPTLRKFISGAKEHLDSIPGGSKMQALMFAIYYAAVTSLTPGDCMVQFGEEKAALLAKYRFGTEQALAKADILNSMEIVTLQALVIFLICLRCHDDSRLVWTLTSLAIRIAQALDLHRDDSSASLSPFNTELRRRLWWQICLLDGRAAEDRGSDPMILEQAYNTMMPSNINDEDIDPDKDSEIVNKEGYTETTFCLICHEVSVTIRQLNYVPPGLNSGLMIDTLPSLAEKERLVSECHQRLEQKYLRYCDISIPFSWATVMVTRMIMARMWLVVHKPLQRQGGGVSPPPVDKEKILLTATEVIEYAHLLETEASAFKWRWFFGTWHQWYALALALAELCVQTEGPAVDRAWRAVDSVFDSWAEKVADSRTGMLWRPITKLRNKARHARDSKGSGDVPMAEDPLLDFEGDLSGHPPAASDPLLSSMPDYPMSSLEAGTEGLLPSSSGAQGLISTPLPHSVDLNQWTVNDEPPPPPSQGMGNHGDQFNWAGWDEFMRASQRENSGGMWPAQLGTWWQ